MRQRFILGILVLSVTASSGCVAVAVGAGAGVGTYAYVKGVTELIVNAPYNDAWHATGETLREFEITITSQTRDALSGSYKGERHDGTNVIVDVESISRDKTRLRIRAGAFGDRTYQEQIGNDVQQRL